MYSESDLQQIAVELDEAHARAKAAFSEKDIDGYMAIFSPNLAYQQPNGKTIGFGELKKNLAVQFERNLKTKSTYTRKKIESTNADVVENLIQESSLEWRVFFFFTRRFHLHRRGLYTWTKIDKRWVISKVVVSEERYYKP